MEEIIIKYYHEIINFFNANSINIIVNVISSILFLLVGILIGYFINLKKYFSKRNIQKYIFSFQNIVIFSGSKKLRGNDNIVIRNGDFYTILKIINFIKSFSPLSEIEVSEPSNEVNIAKLHDKNIIAIGGPNNNPIVKSIFAKLEEKGKLKYKFEDYCIKSVDNESFCLEKDNKNKIIKDYGLIYVLNNPFSKKKIIIFAGCKSFGTFAATSSFSSKEFITYKNKEIKANNFVVLVECIINQDKIISYNILKEKTYILENI